MAPQNRGLIFKQVPNGYPVPGQDLTVEDVPFDFDAPAPEGGIVLKVLYSSFDPYQRGRMRDPSVKSYSAPFTLGQPIDNGSIGEVIKSSNANFKEGQLVRGTLPIQEYVSIPEQAIKARNLSVLENPLDLDVRHFLGALGMPGLTAYSSLYAIGQPKKGETLFVSAASGAVGSLVGQIAKREGLKVIGSVGSDAKLDYILNELGFDAGFNYKKEKPGDALARLAPQGIDIYYENVGGEHLDAAINAMNTHGRIVACGMISQYNAKPGEQYGVKNAMQIVGKRIKMQGFIVFDKDMGPKYAEEHAKRVSQWIKDGSFNPRIHQTDGIENGPKGLLGIFKGENFGKAVLKLVCTDK
ncbi:NADP-dependent leukotriene B4 12-hydroxydehydrogenase [Ascosphaera apis ARSEF 7405]|uniref:NADP-dependent leukotriene B4 12-hydroxydehydrogenase n=1 Tax=Ascosphaera apis ARSEF 7405 TaxID=392613 RepID=A0A166NAB3_9EURO|nr:NADP-dependent leukotriene B4 12-hydroxydehydrogenase [Ascosphaera apis ARSEF 7405]